MSNIKKKSFSMQDVFIKSLIISAVICLLSLYSGVLSAEETEDRASLNQNCATVNEQMTIVVPCAEFSNTRFNVVLDIYPNPTDAEGLYFRLRDLPEISEASASCAFLDGSLNMNINCASFDGSEYKLVLENYANSLDDDWFYWKVADDEQNLVIQDAFGTYYNQYSAALKNLDSSFNKNEADTVPSDNNDIVNIQPASSSTGITRAGKPNLKPYIPSGWSDKIVVSITTGTTTNSSSFTTNDTIYIDYAYENNGTEAASTKFYTTLYVDGVQKRNGYISSLSAGRYGSCKDYSIGKLSAGTHTIKIKTDATGVISESNESDNEYTKTITVGSTKPVPPASMSATALSSSSIKVTWSDSSNNETGFYLYRWNGSSWSNIKTLGAGTTSHTDTVLTANTTYYYYVASYNSAGTSPFNGNSNGYVSAKTLSSIFNPVGRTWSGSIQVQVTSGAYKNFSVNNLTFDSFGKWTAKTTSNYSNIYGQVMPLGTNSYQGSYVMSGNTVSDKEGKFKMTFSDNNHLTGSFDRYSNFTLTR